MKRIAFPLALLSLSVIFFSATAHSQAPGKTYNYVIINTEGRPQPADEFLKRFITLLFKRIGENVQISILNPDAAAKGIAARTVDFTMISHDNYADYRDKKTRFTSVLALATTEHNNEYRCVVVPKKFPYAGVQSLAGKSFVAPWNKVDYYGYRWFFESKGVNLALDKFLGPMIATQGQSTAMEAVAAGKIDSGIVAYSGYALLQRFNSGVANKIKLVDCHELPWPPQPVVWFGTADQEKLKKFYSALASFNPATDPDFKQFLPLIKTLKIKIYLVTDKDYDPFLKIVAGAKKKGWDAEFKRIAANAK